MRCGQTYLTLCGKITYESPVNDEIEILRRIQELRQIDTTAEGSKFLPHFLFHSLDLKSSQFSPVELPFIPSSKGRIGHLF